MYYSSTFVPIVHRFRAKIPLVVSLSYRRASSPFCSIILAAQTPLSSTCPLHLVSLWQKVPLSAQAAAGNQLHRFSTTCVFPLHHSLKSQQDQVPLEKRQCNRMLKSVVCFRQVSHFGALGLLCRNRHHYSCPLGISFVYPIPRTYSFTLFWHGKSFVKKRFHYSVTL